MAAAKPMTPPDSLLLTPAARLAASRERLRLALHPATPPTWAAQAHKLWRPSLQSHPVLWVLAALVAGGVGALLWRRIPTAWWASLKTALSTTLGTVGQDALLAWWLSTLTARQPSEAAPQPSTEAPESPPASSAGV